MGESKCRSVRRAILVPMSPEETSTLSTLRMLGSTIAESRANMTGTAASPAKKALRVIFINVASNLAIKTLVSL